MSIVLQGSTSGSITLQEPAVAGSNTINLPAATGTMALLQTPSFATTIGVGNATPSTSGAGITFPATQSASTDANTLDDYEEGTFTPTAVGGSSAGTTTYTTQTGSYTKIGRQVTVQIRLGWSALTGTGELQLQNLPFTPNGEYIGACITNNLNWPAGFSSMATYVPANAPFVVIFYSRDDGTWDTQQCVNEAADVRLTMTYFVG